MVEIRVAIASDAKEIRDIYAPNIIHTAYTFETEVPSVAEFEQRIKKYTEKFPWLVCLVNGKIAGYVYATSHRDREAYQWTCESSVYIHDDFKGKGIGKRLYAVLFELLKQEGYKTIYAGITLPNDASVLLHEKCGFKHFATYENVGYKLGAWQKVGWWKLQINDYDQKPSPPLKFSEMDPLTYSDLLGMRSQEIQSLIG
jgi:L-amino acid N-acyltransferase YncA